MPLIVDQSLLISLNPSFLTSFNIIYIIYNNHLILFITEWNGQEGNNFTPIQGPDWNDICNKMSFALISPCSDLVNPDITLTQQGDHVKGTLTQRY